jgi:hypothetical protein
VAVQGDYAYVGNGYPGVSGLFVLSLANPANPTRVGFTDTVGEPNHITLRGRYAYLTTGYEWSGFQIVDIFNPVNPVETGAVIGSDLPGGGYDVALNGNRAYVADWGTVRLVDVSNPNAPYARGYYDPGFLSYIYAVATDGTYVYLTDAEDFDVLDWTDPVSPTVVGGLLNALGWGQDIGLSGDFAYVAADQYGLFALDISVSEQISLVHNLETPGLALDVEIVEGLIYVALGDGGLAIFSASQYASAPISSDGGTLLSPDGMVSYIFPAGAFTETILVTHTALLPGRVPAPTGSLADPVQAFELEATHASTGQPAQPAGTFTITAMYDPQGLGPAKESSLALYSWGGTSWRRESTAPPDMVAHTVVAAVDHFSFWAVLGETERVFLPMSIVGSTESTSRQRALWSNGVPLMIEKDIH